MSQSKLERAENLLLLMPFIFLFLISCFLPGQYIVIPFPGEDLPVSQAEITLLWLVLVSVPYLFHYILRKTLKGDKVITGLHLALTILVILILAVTYNEVPLISNNWANALFPLPQYTNWQYAMRLVGFLWQTFLLIQVFFIFYALMVILSKK
jgi:hypothetical protein